MHKFILILLIAVLPVASVASELRDPTRPHTYRVVRAEGTPDFIVNAIFVSSDRRLAVVNGERVRVGDVVSGATVIEIEKEHLTLSVGGRQVVARLKQRRSQ